MYFQGNINKHTNVEQELFKDYSNYFESSAIPTINKLQISLNILEDKIYLDF